MDAYEAKELFNYRDAKQDPFRCIKISDAALNTCYSVFISKAENFHPKKDKPASIQMFCEQLYNMLDDKPEIYAYGELAFDDKLTGKTYQDRDDRKNAVSCRIDPADIVTACKAFYLPKIQDEYERFYKGGKDENYVKPLLDVKFADNEFPIRVGHFSHCLCVTVDRLRKPSTRSVNGRPLPWNTTRTASRGVPFGWVKVSLEKI
jgi:hypothetical protein